MLVDPEQGIVADRREVRQAFEFAFGAGDVVADRILGLVEIVDEIAQARDLRVEFLEPVLELLRQVLDFHGVVLEALRGFPIPAQQLVDPRLGPRHLLAGGFHGIEGAIEHVFLFQGEILGLGEREQPLRQGFGLVLKALGLVQTGDALGLFQLADLLVEVRLAPAQGLDLGAGGAQALFESGHFVAGAARFAAISSGASRASASSVSSWSSRAFARGSGRFEFGARRPIRAV